MYGVIGIYGFARLLRLPYPPAFLGRAIVLVVLSLFLGSILPGIAISLAGWWQTGVFSAHRSVRVIGGMAAALPTAYFIVRYYGIPAGRAFDLGGLPIPLGLAIGRLGCLAAGCCGGVVTESWLGLRLPDNLGTWAVRYPTQLLSAAADLSIFLVLLGWERLFRDRGAAGRSFPFNGFLFLLFLELYFIKRILIQFLRSDNVPLWGPFSATHLFFLAGLAAVSALIAWNLRTARTGPPRFGL